MEWRNSEVLMQGHAVVSYKPLEWWWQCREDSEAHPSPVVKHWLTWKRAWIVGREGEVYRARLL